MSSENTKDRADRQSLLPDNNALNHHADRLIDDLFADIDNILEEGTRLPGQSPTSDYRALKSSNVPQVTLPPGTSTSSQNVGLPPLGYSQTNPPQDRQGNYLPPQLIPPFTPESSQSAPNANENMQIPQPGVEAEPQISENSVKEPINSEVPRESYETPVPTRSKSFLDRFLFWSISATFAGLAALGLLWLASQYRLNVQRTADATDAQTTPVAPEETEFINYMQRSLKIIDRKPLPTIPQSTGQTLPPGSNIPVLSPGLPSVSPPFANPPSVSIPVPPPVQKKQSR
jgi:hypothetical protein